MLHPLPYPSTEAELRLRKIAERKPGADPAVSRQVEEILDRVRRHGDTALLEYTRSFDAPGITSENLTVGEHELAEAYDKVDGDFREILRNAVANIESFHKHQVRSSYFSTNPDGTFLGQIVRPVASAGLYIPGGKGGETPLVSSVLMNGIPARIAGVPDLAMVTPPRRDGSINPYLLVAAQEVGISRIHKIGSAWAIAALAFGTERVRRVDMIVGPGNVYVALAKKMVSGEVGIDLLAGPSEILVIADEKADAACIAADLLSQAEHDSMASAVCVTTDESVATKTCQCLLEQIKRLPRQKTAWESLESFGAVFVVAEMEEALELANRIAPEHLELQVRDPWSLVGKIENAGAVFLGDWTPEALGDYFAGPNHVLPTSGTARFASALGVDNFLKRTSIVAYSKTAMERDARAVMRMAELEGLEAHAASVRLRLTRNEI
ncbi:MAG: histidinol dehydrogenase [Deltaproteobacteria bacterium]|nr:histidinol dehydrogenase [Deltaproteobacteria bacterium]